MADAVVFSSEEREALLGSTTGDLVVCSVHVGEGDTEAQVSAEVRLSPDADDALIERSKAAVASAVDGITSGLAGEVK